MPLGTEVGLRPGHIVFDGDPAPPPQRGRAPNFRPTSFVVKRLDALRCTWYEVGLGPGNFVLDADPLAPPQKGGRSPQFSAYVYCGQTAGWIKIALGTEVGLGPVHIVLDWIGTQLHLPRNGGGRAPNFWPVSIVAKRLDGSQWHFAWRWVSVQATLC